MSKSLYSQNYKKVVRKLKDARVESGLTQVEVANKLKRPQSYVSKIERGERRVDVAELVELAAVYKKQINYFVPKS